MTTSTRLTATGQTMGTVRYMSPEQVRGKPVDERTDIYSLGASLYEALVGETPFDGETHFEIMTKHLHDPPKPPSAHGIDLPAEVDAVVLRALAKNPDERFGSATEMREALEACVAAAEPGEGRSPPLVAGSLGDVGSEVKVGARRRSWWIALAVVVAVASLGVVAALVLGGPAPRSGVVPAPADAQATETTPDWPQPFQLPDLAFEVDQTYEGDRLRILAVGPVDPEHLRSVVVSARARFAAFLRERGSSVAVVEQPMTLEVVPRQLLCDDRIYREPQKPDARAPQTCRNDLAWYRPHEKTLLLAAGAERSELEANVAFHVALAVCLHSKPRIALCDGKLLEDFDVRQRAAR